MAELVHSFLLPEVERQDLRERGERLKPFVYISSDLTSPLSPHLTCTLCACSEAQPAQTLAGSSPHRARTGGRDGRRGGEEGVQGRRRR